MSGITNTTVKNLILDAGVVYINYGDTQNERILGCSAGGNKFSVEREFRDIELDGKPGKKIKGLKRLISEDCSLEINLKEMSAKNIQIALAGSTISNYPAATPTHDMIVSNGAIVDADYISNVALVAPVSGSTQPCIIILYNALSDGNLELNLKDKDEAVIALTLSAHYDPTDLTEPLYEIRYPKIV